jgi:hypothetical protein
VTPIRARAILLALVALIGFGWQHTASALPPSGLEGKTRDVVLYRETVGRLRAGDPYYVAVGNAMRRYGYPTRSVFNWRTPLHLQIVAALGITPSEWLMRGLAFLAIVSAGWALGARSTRLAVAAIISLFGAMMVPLLSYEAVLLPETWAGILIGLSLAAYHRQRWIAGALLAVTAIFMRELAAPYVLVCGIIALFERRRTEAAIWIAAGVSYAVYYWLHALNASAHIQLGDVSHEHSWVQFQGLAFVLLTLRDYGWVILLGTFVAPLACALGLAATAAPSMPQQLKYALLAYVAFFAAVGQPFDDYWGLVSTAIWGYAFVYGAEAMNVLIAQAFTAAESRAAPIEPCATGRLSADRGP